MRFLTVVFSSAEELRAHYSDRYPNGALFCPTRADVSLREDVIVDVSLPGMRHPARLQGRVISHSSGRGMWVHLNLHSRSTVDYLLELADQPAADSSERTSRTHARYPTRLNVSCRIDERDHQPERLSGEIVDLSRGGAFISGDAPPLVGTRVSLDIGPLPGSSKSLKLDGRVAWVGTMAHQKGFGVRFDPRGRGARPLRTMLRRASELGSLVLSH
jgi:Tfp pilus assembly protein PilZ